MMNPILFVNSLLLKRLIFLMTTFHRIMLLVWEKKSSTRVVLKGHGDRVGMTRLTITDMFKLALAEANDAVKSDKHGFTRQAIRHSCNATDVLGMVHAMSKQKGLKIAVHERIGEHEARVAFLVRREQVAMLFFTPTSQDSCRTSYPLYLERTRADHVMQDIWMIGKGLPVVICSRDP
jgi:hypothetical protein